MRDERIAAGYVHRMVSRSYMQHVLWQARQQQPAWRVFTGADGVSVPVKLSAMAELDLTVARGLSSARYSTEQDARAAIARRPLRAVPPSAQNVVS